MKKLILIILALLTLSAIAMAQACYDKLKVGSSWEMTMYSKKGKVIGKSTSKIVDIKNEGGEIIYIIEAQSYNKKGKPDKHAPTIVKGKCKNGKYYMDMQQFAKSLNSEFDKNKETKDISVEFEMSEAEIPQAKTSAGTTLKDAYMKIITKYNTPLMPSTEMSIHLQNRKVEAIEDKKTPAGIFKCQKVTADVLIKVAFIKQRMKTIEWYTDGFFVVYSEYYSKKGKLMNYNVLTKLDI